MDGELLSILLSSDWYLSMLSLHPLDMLITERMWAQLPHLIINLELSWSRPCGVRGPLFYVVPPLKMVFRILFGNVFSTRSTVSDCTTVQLLVCSQSNMLLCVETVFRFSSNNTFICKWVHSVQSSNWCPLYTSIKSIRPRKFARYKIILPVLLM